MKSRITCIEVAEIPYSPYKAEQRCHLLRQWIFPKDRRFQEKIDSICSRPSKRERRWFENLGSFADMGSRGDSPLRGVGFQPHQTEPTALTFRSTSDASVIELLHLGE